MLHSYFRARNGGSSRDGAAALFDHLYSLCKQVPSVMQRSAVIQCVIALRVHASASPPPPPLQAAQFLADGWGTHVLSHDDTSCSMRMVQLPPHCGHTPAHADAMRRTLRTQHAIETQTALPAVVDGNPCLCLRISAAEYNEMADYERLLAAVNALPRA